MSRRRRRSGLIAILILVGLLAIVLPAGFALAQDLTDPVATTQSNHTVLPIIKLTSTPTETPTATATQTATPTPTATATPTPTSGGGGGGGDGDRGADGQRLVVDKGSGTAGGVTSEEDCSNAEYTTIQRAVNDAAPGDTVEVCAGTYTESVTVETGNLTLRTDGNAVIESTGQPAVRINAPRVTVRGFTLHAKQAAYVITVGGHETLIRDNTVEPTTSNSTGIFLSDGRTAGGDPDLSMGAATGSRILNNTINATLEATLGQGDTASPTASNEGPDGIDADADKTIISDNTFYAEDDSNSIRSSGNRTLIRNNIIQHVDPCTQGSFNNQNECKAYNNMPAILVGKYNPEAYYRIGGSMCAGPGNNSTHARHNWARHNRIVNNTVVNSPGEGIYVMGTGTHSEILSAIKGAVVQNNRLDQTGGIAGWSNYAVFRNNAVDADHYLHEETPLAEGDNENALCLHAHNTRIIGNTLNGYTGPSLSITGAQNVTIQKNDITYGNPGLRVDMRAHWRGEVEVVQSIRITNNTIRNGSSTFGGVVILENISEFTHNTITGSRSDGVRFSAEWNTSTTRKPEISEFHHNRIIGNSQTGIVITPNSTIREFHHNLIDNNGYLGINKENQDKTDSRWPIVNATHNIWGCGGPSSGLQDPYTNRTANGSGDSISAGDEPGMSNIHFDPFLVRSDVDCPLSGSTPTPTPTPSPTPTPTATPPGGGTGGDSGDGSGGSGGSGTGSGAGGSAGSGDGGGGDSGDGSGGDSDAPSGSGDSGGSDGETATPPPTPLRTPTATPPPSPTPTATLSPTPAVEPGFGVLTWLVGVAILGSLLAVRRRFDPDEAERND